MPEHSKLAVVQSIERNHDENGPVVEVIADTGGGTLLTLEHFDGAGEDSLPLPGDLVALDESTGQGAARALGYADPKNVGTAQNGEKRLYARDPNTKEPVAELWLKSNGDIAVTSIKAAGKIILNGVEIDQQGNITTRGDVTVKNDTTPITLSVHKHGTGTGPSTPPLFPTP
jgi:hypothetical protein